MCIADDMEKKVKMPDGQEYRGISWFAASKGSGSTDIILKLDLGQII